MLEQLGQSLVTAVASLGVLSLFALISYSSLRTKRLSFGEVSHTTGFFIGALGGLVGLLMMQMPIELQPGVFGDARAVPIFFSALFGGPFGALVSGLIAAGGRFYIGGQGSLAGLGFVLIFFGCGLYYRRLALRDQSFLTAKKLTLYGFIFSCIGAVSNLLMPPGLILPMFQNIWTVMCILNCAGFFLIGRIIENFRMYDMINTSLEKRNQKLERLA